MTTLAQPIAVDHPENWGPDFNRCGADNANAVVSIVIPNSTFAVPDGADADQMIAAISGAYPGAELLKLNANAADLVAQYVSQGWYVIAQCYCDSQADLVPPSHATADHWVTLYGDDPNALPWFQCWTNSFLTIDAQTLRVVSHQNDIHYHVLVRLPGANQAANTQTTGGTPVKQAVPRGGGMLAPRPDNSCADAFAIANDGTRQVYTWQEMPDGTSTAASRYAIAPNPVQEITGATWEGGVLIVEVIGTDGQVYENRFANGAWSGYQPRGFGAATD